MTDRLKALALMSDIQDMEDLDSLGKPGAALRHLERQKLERYLDALQEPRKPRQGRCHDGLCGCLDCYLCGDSEVEEDSIDPDSEGIPF